MWRRRRPWAMGHDVPQAPPPRTLRRMPAQDRPRPPRRAGPAWAAAALSGRPPVPSALPGMSNAASRPASRTATRSIVRNTAGSCSVDSTPAPSRASSASRSAMASLPAGSSCAVGSSSTTTPVPIATMLAMATRCCSPPDSANGSRSARWAIPSRARTVSIRASIADRGTARFSSPNASSSRTVSFEADSWLAGVAKTMPTRPRRSFDSAVTRSVSPRAQPGPRPWRATTRGIKPAASSASVDLPAPVRPATPTRAPAATERLTPPSASVRAAG